MLHCSPGRGAAENRRMHLLRPPGFTLIELMLAVAIAGILAAVAYPAFTSAVQRSRRADAAAVLTAVVQAQERYRSNRSSYAAELTDLGVEADKITKHYTLALAGVGATPSFVSGYQATASVRADSPQAADVDCSTLTARLEGANLVYLATDKNGQDKSSLCWPR